MKLTRVPNWIRKSKSDRIWDFSVSSQSIYLTFDDGPQEEVTEWVLDLLDRENIQATFFCVGHNVSKNPKIFQRILETGHQVGNHSFSHPNAWKTSTDDYLKDIEKAKKVIRSGYFRPPYGKVSNKIVKAVKKMGMTTVMWSLLSYDFEDDLDTDKQLKNLFTKVEPGDIVVFHDSQKSFSNLKKMLPSFVKHVKDQGWSFSRID